MNKKIYTYGKGSANGYHTSSNWSAEDGRIYFAYNGYGDASGRGNHTGTSWSDTNKHGDGKGHRLGTGYGYGDGHGEDNGYGIGDDE